MVILLLVIKYEKIECVSIIHQKKAIKLSKKSGKILDTDDI